MKAPDKIYIQTNAGETLSSKWTTIPFRDFENTEYVRKDALLEQPDNEDIDKVAQELYEHLYELKRRNNVPTNLYDKQEIINLWKAGIEYGRNHPKQDQQNPTCKTCGFYENNCPFIRGTFKPYPNKICKDYTYSVMKEQEQPGVNLEKEIKEWVDLMVGASFPEQDGDFISEEDYRSVIRQTAIHFLELNARKEEKL